MKMLDFLNFLELNRVPHLNGMINSEDLLFLIRLNKPEISISELLSLCKYKNPPIYCEYKQELFFQRLITDLRNIKE